MHGISRRSSARGVDEEIDVLIGEDELESKPRSNARTSCCRLPNLETLNKIAAVSHLLMTVGVLAVAIVNDAKSKCVPITNTFNIGRPSASFNTSSYEVLAGPGVCYGYVAFAFELVCFLAHAYVWAHYEDGYMSILHNEINPWRWLEYAASASLMVICVESVVGLHSLGSVLGFAGCTIATMFTGLWSEQANSKGRPRELGVDWFPFALGCVLQVIVWTGIGVSYVTTAIHIATIPWFVHAFPIQLCFFFNCFALVEAFWLLSKHKSDKWIKTYEDKEWWYVFLSLSSKISLASLIIGSTF